MWAVRSIETLFQDLRYGVRMLLKNPGFTLIAVITLGLGIGANTAIFSLINSLLLRPFDFHDLDRLVCVYETAPQQDNFLSDISPADFADLRRQQKNFADLAAFRLSNSNLTGVRSWPVQGFEDIRAYYILENEVVTILRVLHGRRDIIGILGGN